jgi:hypothetical protein
MHHCTTFITVSSSQPDYLPWCCAGGLLLIDTQTNPPTGLIVQHLNNITQKIAAAYNRRYLTLQWTYLVPSDDIYDQLQVHVLTRSIV